MSLAVGNRILDRYEVVRAIKSGGMGAVYEARDLRLANSPCAIKEILEGVAAGPDADYVADKFKAEVEALATLDHPGIPKVRDFFRVEKTLYIVMEFVAGKSLDDELADCQEVTGRPLEPEVVAGDTLQVLEILAYLHGRQMLHRDLKPSNLVREGATGRVKLVDFGLARAYGDQQMMTMVGTPGYSAPEQLSGRAEPRSDLYALGVTMHHLLSGVTPRMLDLQPLQQHMPDYRPGLAAIVDKATRPKPSERYESAESMLAALREWCRLEHLRRAAASPATAREAEPPAPVRDFVQAPTTVIAPAPIPTWIPGLILGVLGLGLGLLLGARPPAIKAAVSPSPALSPVALVAPPAVAKPSPPTPVRQPNYDVYRPAARKTPKPVARPVATPAPVVRATPRPVPVARPAYPTAHKRPKPARSPEPLAAQPPALGNPPPMGPPRQPDPPQQQGAIPAQQALDVNLPPNFAIEWNDMTGVIHPSPPMRGPGNRQLPRLRVQLRANVWCLDVPVPQDRALDQALAQQADRFPGAHPMRGLAPNERGIMTNMPGGLSTFVLVKGRPEGSGTRLCFMDGGGNSEGLASLREISRGMRLR